MTANKTLLRMKSARVIEAYATRSGCSLSEALDWFYRSATGALMCDGVSDMHCMSVDYLVEELLEERATHQKTTSFDHDSEVEVPPLCVAEPAPPPYEA